jgi:competence protein ComEC
MENLRNLPFLKLLLPFLLSILLRKYFLHASWVYYAIVLLFSLLAFIFLHTRHYSSKKGIHLKAIALFLHVFCWGLFISSYHQKKPPPPYDFEYPLELTMESSWQFKNNHYSARASFQNGSLYDRGDVLLRLKTTTPPDGSIGDQLITNNQLQEIQLPKNPLQFDYKNYLANEGISYTIYLKEDEFILFIKAQKNFIQGLIRSRDLFGQLLDESPLEKEVRSFIKAILLGDKSELDPLTSKAFKTAGVTHVLAVSGLHVGIIVSLFSVFFTLLFSRIKKEKTQWLKTILLVLVIWCYALITGLSPSIYRAAIMFTFLSIGQSLIRHTSIYNSLSMAAFFMLLIDPNNLFKLGFQLSFLAVTGIVYFYPIFSKMIYFKNKWLQKVWNLCAVSLSAQLVTFPLILFYFHQFPSYFLISNLIIIPAAFIIVLLSIFLLLFWKIKFLLHAIAFILNKLIGFIIWSMEEIMNFPHSSIDQIYFSQSQLIASLLIIFLLALYFHVKKGSIICYILCFSILIFTSRIFHKFEQMERKELFIYHFPYRSAIDLISNQEHVLFMDSLSIKEPSKLEYNIQNHLLNIGLSSVSKCDKIGLEDINERHPFFLKSTNHLLFFNSIICFNHSSHEYPLPSHFEHKILFMNKAIEIKKTELDNYSHLVLNLWATKAKKELQENLLNEYTNTKLINIKEDGFYRLNLALSHSK